MTDDNYTPGSTAKERREAQARKTGDYRPGTTAKERREDKEAYERQAKKTAKNPNSIPSTPSERSQRRTSIRVPKATSQGSTPRWHAAQETWDEYLERTGQTPTPEVDAEKADKLRAKRGMEGRSIFCPTCRSGSTRRRTDGLYECVSNRRQSCEKAGVTSVFTREQAIKAAESWYHWG